MNRRHCLFAVGLGCVLPRLALAHHGWSSFDQSRPIWLEGKAAKVAWRNPHVELELALDPDLKLPTDLASRPLPAQSVPVEGARLMAAATLPTRRDRLWELELAPLTRMQAWKVEEIRPGTPLAVLGFTFTGEKGDAVLRVEYLFVAGKTYGLRSSPT